MATLPEIVFKGGNEELREFPQQLRQQLLDHLNQQARTEPDWGVLSSSNRDNLFQDDEGRPAHFATRGTDEHLLAARFGFGRSRVTIVKEKEGHTINGGQPALLCFSRNVPRKVNIDNIEYSAIRYHIWRPDHDARDKGNSQAEVIRYVCTDDDYILSQSLSQTQAHTMRPNSALAPLTVSRNPLMDELLGVPDFPRLSVTDFNHREGDLTLFPQHLVDEINNYCASATQLPSCMRDPNSKSIIVRNGRTASFITSDTEQELSVGLFRELRNKPGKDYIVVKAKDGSKFNDGRAMLIGEFCSFGISRPVHIRNGKECTASGYHLWTPQKDREHVAKKCDGQVVLKLLERPPKKTDDKRSADIPKSHGASPKSRPKVSNVERTSFREVVGLRSHNEPGLEEQTSTSETSKRRAAVTPISYAPPVPDLDDYEYDEEVHLAAWTGSKRRASSVSERTEHTVDSDESVQPEAKRQKPATEAMSATPSKSIYATGATNGEVSDRIQKLYMRVPEHSVEWPEDENTKMEDDLNGHSPNCPALGGSHKSCQCPRPCSHTCRNKATCAHACCRRSARFIQDDDPNQPTSTEPSRTQQGFLNTQDVQQLPPMLREPRLPLIDQPAPGPAYVLPERTSPKLNPTSAQHMFLFKVSRDGSVMRHKTTRVCNTVVQLFGHAKVAGIADSETAILICHHNDEAFNIVKGDTEDFETFLETLKDDSSPQQIIVLPDIVDKRDIKLENEKLRAENASLKEEITAKVQQIQQQKEQFRAAITAMCEKPS